MNAPLETTQDRLLDGAVQLVQLRRGFRANVDSILLAAAVDLPQGTIAVEFGCGAGAALLSAAHLHPGGYFVGVERDLAAFDCAQASCLANPALRARIGLVAGDALRLFADNSVDLVFANPPFWDPQATARPRALSQAALLESASLADWIKAMARALQAKGALVMIHRAERLGEALAALARSCGKIAVLPIAPYVDAPASRILLRAEKGSRAPLRLLPPLVLHDRAAPAKYTEETEQLLRGRARIAWEAGRVTPHADS